MKENSLSIIFAIMQQKSAILLRLLLVFSKEAIYAKWLVDLTVKSL